MKVKEPVELTLISPNYWADQGLTNLIARYEEATGNQIKLDVYPDDQYLSVEKTRMSTNDAPDLLYLNMGETYVPYSFLEPLDPSIGERMIDVLKKTAMKNGKVYEAPADIQGFYGVIYNKEVFRKAGIELPLLTYQALIEACEKLMAIGVTPIGVRGKSAWTPFQIPTVAGNYIFHKDMELGANISANKVQPQDTLFVEMSERFVSLTKYMNKDFLSATNADIQQGLLDGTIAMNFYPDFDYNEIIKIDPEKFKNLGYMPATLGDDYINVGVGSDSGRAFAIPANAEHKQEAQEFILFMSQADNLKVLVDTYKGNAPYKDIQLELNEWQQEMVEFMNAGNIPAAPVLVGYFNPEFKFGDINTPFNDMLAGKPVDEALSEWYRDYAKVNGVAKTPGF